MKLENAFEVPAPRERAWELLMDVPRVVPCMPGATLRETVSDDHWKADLAVKLGPIALNFDTDVTRESVDETAGSVTLGAKAREKRGRGGAQAAIRSTLTELGPAIDADRRRHRADPVRRRRAVRTWDRAGRLPADGEQVRRLPEGTARG